MKAIGYQLADSLLDLEQPDPVPEPHDLLVEVKAVSVNPVDIKVRERFTPEHGDYKILGWDAAGVVRKTGSGVSHFKPGDEVWYAGSINRPGCNSQLHAVDERIAALKPQSLSFAEAAAIPLTAITAWELLFDRLSIPQGLQDRPGQLLIIGAAGGVGSILTQLARQLTDMTIIGTACRSQSRDWVLSMGADYVIDHTQAFLPQLKQAGLHEVTHVASLTHSDDHYPEIIECLAPQGKLGLIDDPHHIDISLMKQKSISLHWEFMFTRPLFKTQDMIRQQDLLTKIAKKVDAGLIKTTLHTHFGAINAKNLERAHQHIKTGRAIGKGVLEGF